MNSRLKVILTATVLVAGLVVAPSAYANETATATAANDANAIDTTQAKKLLRAKGCVVKAKGNCSRKNLSGMNFEDLDLTGMNFSGANLSKAVLTGATLDKANFTGANLQGADLSGTSAKATNFTGANLRAADLSDADMGRVNLSKVKA